MKIENLKLKISQRGFTLTEVIVVTAIATIIFMAVFHFSQDLFSWNSSTQRNLEAQSGARRILKTMVKELRSASPSSLGAYPVVLASSTAITFFSNIDSDAYKEQIRYFLDGVTLKKGVIKPSGSPLNYNPANESIVSVIGDVRNGVSPIFEYFDNTYTGTSSPLSYPVSTTDVRLVRIKVYIDKDPNKPPEPLQVESQVFLRNLKDNL